MFIFVGEPPGPAGLGNYQ